MRRISRAWMSRSLAWPCRPLPPMSERAGVHAAARRRRSSGGGHPFEIIPGVTSAVAVPAYAGIPLTIRAIPHRRLRHGAEDPTKGKSDLDWEALAGIGTLVFLMGVKNLPAIAENLIRCGKDATTPAALIRRGTTPDQETLTGTLGDIARKGRGTPFRPARHPRRRGCRRPPGNDELVRDETPLRPGDRHHAAGGAGRRIGRTPPGAKGRG